jgi:hypothetical protein
MTNSQGARDARDGAQAINFITSHYHGEPLYNFL